MQTTHFSQLLGECAASRSWEAAFLGDGDGDGTGSLHDVHFLGRQVTAAAPVHPAGSHHQDALQRLK